MYQDTEKDPSELYKVSQFLRNNHRGDIVTYSRKVFFNLINLCVILVHIVLINPNQVRQKFQCYQQKILLNWQALEKNTNALRHYLSQVRRPEQKYQEARDMAQRKWIFKYCRISSSCI